METLQELFEDSIKDIYSAEKQLLKGMQKMGKKAQSEALKTAVETHIAQSEAQVQRLEEVGKAGGFKLSGKVCKAAQGLVEEATEHLEEGKPGPVLDAAIIACLQKNEHYEITSYGSAIAWAQELGQKDAVNLLKATLAEEKETDKLLTGIAKQGVNRNAEAQPAEKKPAEKKPATKKPAAKKTASSGSK